ncbi:hypothetical protein BU17DRAFT_51192 [Hysterangium stoloniferum]|nr:hypothetical protein BU17DRAFT_51192 [Hysterangium stoloniferum]
MSSTPLLRPRAGLFSPFPNANLLWKAGALIAALGIINGAFGAHALKRRIPDPAKLQAWGTASHYAIFNGVALLAISMHPRFSVHRFAGPAIGIGALVFSGSIWALTLDHGRRFKWLGPVTPLGGSLMIFG